MDNKKKKTIDIAFKIFLIIVIILLLIHNCELIKEKNNQKIPTGNVDIIEISCDKDNTCEETSSNKDRNTKNNNKNNDNQPTNNEDDDEPGEEIFTVEDKLITWNGYKEVKIFSNSMYNIEGVIAPEDSNTYQFIVKNGTNYTINYIINFIETNPYNINMKYKLKKNDTYVIDHYVSASELNQTGITLNPKKNDTYYLEWKWISSSNDTQIGETINAKYELKIEVKAESNNV